MPDGDFIDRVSDDRLWDADGREWSTRRARWATGTQAKSFVGRGHPVGLVAGVDEPVQWLEGDQAAQWWVHARSHFQVPGASSAPPDEHGRTWGAHIYSRDEQRCIVFETFC